MGYELKIFFHPRKEEGGYNTEVKEETIVSVGKPFDDTPLERLAAVVMAQMARRDILVLDVLPTELVRNEISFKECKDGKGIVLKNKKFSFNEAAQMVVEDMGVPDNIPQQMAVASPQQQMMIPINGVQHPHELLNVHRQQASIDDLYGNANRPAPIIRQNNSQLEVPINQKKVLYHVYFEPYFYEKEAARLKLKFTTDKKYPVHQIIPDPSGRLDAQKLAVTDDTGRVVKIDEKYFSSAGAGLLADKDNRFSGANTRTARKPKLAYENEMYIDAADQNMAAIPHNIPVDDGNVPEELMQMPDIRPAKRR